MARRARDRDAELIAAMLRLWDTPEVQRIQGQLMANYVEDYAIVSWGLARKVLNGALGRHIRQARRG